MIDIRKAGGRSLYFPFLDNKQGKIETIEQQASLLILYALLVDRVVLPPRSFLGTKCFKYNMNFASEDKLLHYLFESGSLVTTTGHSVRDDIDLINIYSNGNGDGYSLNSPSAKNFPLTYFSRDVEYQKKVFADYFSCHMQGIIASQEDKNILEDILSNRYDYSTLIQQINVSKISAVSRIVKLSQIAYFYAGAKGNGTIIPPLHANYPSTFFDFMYSKHILGKFGATLERRLLCPLSDISIEKFIELKSSLNIFSDKYFYFANKYSNLFSQINRDILKNKRLGFRLPLASVQSILSLIIGSILTYVFGSITLGASATLISAYALEVYLKLHKLDMHLTNTIYLILGKMNLTREYYYELVCILDDFEKSTIKFNR